MKLWDIYRSPGTLALDLYMSFFYSKSMKFSRSLLTIFLFYAFATQAKTLTTEVVAKIGKDIVTSRKVVADTIVENHWAKPNGESVNSSVQSEEFNNDLNRYLMERVVYLESRSFSLINVTESEVEKTKKSLLAKIKASSSSSMWNDLSLTSEELSDLVKQKLSSQKFIDFKSKASYVPVTEAEAFNYYNNNKSKYEGKEYKMIKEGIKKSLAKLQAEQRLEDWYDILKKKYDVTKTISYVAPSEL